MPSPSLDGRDVRKRFRIACATAHGVGGGMSALELMDYVWLHGLPSLEAREQLVAARDAAEEADGGTTPPSSPPQDD